MSTSIYLTIMLLTVAPLWSQATGAEPAASGPPPSASGAAPDDDQRMATPAPVGGEGYSLAFTSEERGNYLRGGLNFLTAYNDNLFIGANGRPSSDVSYTLLPTIALDLFRARVDGSLSYSPGFTFYQKTSSHNEADQSLAVNLKVRLSPHVNLNLQDSLQKTSNIFSQAILGPTAVFGSPQAPNDAVIPPLASILRNTGSAQITYQFSANAMVGAGGVFSNLHYPNPAQVPGLSDSSSKGGSAFYTQRLSRRHYIGATYQYQTILATPNQIQNTTQTHSVVFFYTIYLQRTLSVSIFGGPQYSDTEQTGLPSSRKWSPSTGASVGWQGLHTSLAASYSHTISDGGGLGGAVHSSTASASLRQQFTRTLSAGVGANYFISTVLDPLISSVNSGHTVSGNVELQRSFGQHFNLGIGYMRMHQSYGNILAISTAPNRDQVTVSLAYQFRRPLGR
jgi:hypothetical protein